MVLKQFSYVFIPEHDNYTQSWTAAYSFQDIDGRSFSNIADGLSVLKRFTDIIKNVYHLSTIPLHLEKELINFGLNYIDIPAV